MSNIYIYVNIHTYVSMYECVYAFMCACACVYMSTFITMYACIYVYVCMCLCVDVYVSLCDINDTSPCRSIKFKTKTYIVRAMGEPIPVVASSGLFFTSQKRAIEFMLYKLF